MNRNTALRPSGFTLIELMIVLVIIAVIAGIATVNLSGATAKAKRSATQTKMKAIVSALEQYNAEHNGFPPTGQGLQLLIMNRTVTSDAAKDAWGRDFDYYSPTTDFPFVLISYGEDGLQNTPDDIREFPKP